VGPGKQRFQHCQYSVGGWPLHTGGVSAEYCERPTTTGKPCRGTASALKWTEERRDNKIFREYRREYKRRFAWIKAGKIEPDAFYAWSEKAREKKAECDDEIITLEEYREWLKNS